MSDTYESYMGNPNSKVDPQDELREQIKIQPEEVYETPAGEQSYLDGDEDYNINHCGDDPHMGMGYEDYEPSPYDGTYSEM